MKANRGHKNLGRPFRFLLVLALLAVLGLGVTPPLGTAAPQESKMYVTNYGNDTISQANLDGTGGVSLGNLNGTLNGPWGIALDLAAGEMYVTNNGNSTIRRANLDGTGGVSLGGLNGTLNGPVGIALALVTPQPVGGYAVAVSRVKLLAPWLGLVAVALAVAGAALSWRRSA